MTQTKTVLLTMLLFGATLAVLAPSAAAHTCSSSNDNCNQPCDSGEAHDHSWYDSRGYHYSCSSSGPSEPGPTELPTPCDIYWLVYEIFDESALEIKNVRCAFDNVQALAPTAVALF